MDDKAKPEGNSQNISDSNTRDDVDALDARLRGAHLSTWQEYAELRNAPLNRPDKKPVDKPR